MLPEALLALLAAALAAAQSRQMLTLNQITSLTSLAQPRSVPPSPRLAISVALCAAADPQPRFFLSNVSADADVPGPAGGEGVWEIELEDGMGSWEGPFTEGGVLAVAGSGSVPFDVGVSDGDPLHQNLLDLPLLGDTTANQALLFSPPFLPFTLETPSYPNYTLPQANMSQPPLPAASLTPNYTLALFATPQAGPRTACFLTSTAAQRQQQGRVAEEKLWTRDEEGWRTQWLVGGLSPATNYTAFVLSEGSVSGPVWLGTKSAAFNCPLVHSLPFCPSVSYAMPLAAPPAPTLAHTAATLPSSLTTPLLSYMANFTATLKTFACGRDWYSPLVGCVDCEREYRKWLCAVSMVRCGEAPLSASESSSSESGGLSLGFGSSSDQVQTPLQPALIPQSPSTSPRNPFLPAFASPYQALLPCIEQCHQVDRACPPFLSFKCPEGGSGGAERSYGVGYVDNMDLGERGKGQGRTGGGADRWGGVWCNLV